MLLYEVLGQVQCRDYEEGDLYLKSRRFQAPGQPSASFLKLPTRLPSGSIAEAAGASPAAAAPALELQVGICGRASGTGMRRLWTTDPDRAWRRGYRRIDIFPQEENEEGS